MTLKAKCLQARGSEQRDDSSVVRDIQHRLYAMPRGNSGPTTFDEVARTVDIVAATEAPVQIYDWDRGMIDEVLLIDRVKIPSTDRVPLLDSHSRFSSADVLGSVAGFHHDQSTGELLARASFSKVQAADDAMRKLAEGHLTDFSVGYRVNKYRYLDDNETAVVGGREFTGPLKIVTDWDLLEVSITPIGADSNAKARGALDNKLNQQEAKMDPRLRTYLESRGLEKDADEAAAWAFLEALDDGAGDNSEDRSHLAESQGKHQTLNQDQQSAEGPEDPAAIAVRMYREEMTRVNEIRAMGRNFGRESDCDRWIADGTSLEEVRAQILAGLAAQPRPGFAPTINMGLDERDKFRAAAVDSVGLRTGRNIQEPAAGASDLRGFSLRELARESLRIAGRPIGGDVRDMVGRALTTSDFPYIMADVAQKSLLDGYQSADETWSMWCGTGQVSDFKTYNLVRASETDDLEEVPESMEYKYGDRQESREQYSIATYGKLFAITRQAIINDDLGALSDIPRAHGESAARKIGDIAYVVLTANGVMGDGVALFASGHANLGTGGAVSVTTFAEAVKLMKLQKDIQGLRRLNIRPRYFLAPVSLEGSSEQFFNTDRIGGSTNQPNLINPYAGSYITRVYEPRLDDASATAWYLAGPPGKTVVVYFLNGVQAPYMETREGWTVDGVEYKVRIDAGAKAVDWRALVKNAGA